MGCFVKILKNVYVYQHISFLCILNVSANTCFERRRRRKLLWNFWIFSDSVFLHALYISTTAFRSTFFYFRAFIYTSVNCQKMDNLDLGSLEPNSKYQHQIFQISACGTFFQASCTCKQRNSLLLYLYIYIYICVYVTPHSFL